MCVCNDIYIYNDVTIWISIYIYMCGVTMCVCKMDATKDLAYIETHNGIIFDM